MGEIRAKVRLTNGVDDRGARLECGERRRFRAFSPPRGVSRSQAWDKRRKEKRKAATLAALHRTPGSQAGSGKRT
jgi:hypothetical protein